MASITAKEIAKILGLSQAAVSLALRDKPGVSEETRKLVRETAVRMGKPFSTAMQQALTRHCRKHDLLLLFTQRRRGSGFFPRSQHIGLLYQRRGGSSAGPARKSSA